MFTYIVPSIFKFNKFIEQIAKISKIDIIGEILIINNSDEPIHVDIDKVKVIKPQSPSYCNGGWNIGVLNSNYENLILSTEDLLFNPTIFEKVYPLLQDDKVGLIGLNCDPHTEGRYLSIDDFLPEVTDATIEEVDGSRKWGFGFMMFLKKKNFTMIPDEIRHWYGDDFLYQSMTIKGMKNYLLQSKSFKLKTKAGSLSDDPVTKYRIDEDTKNWENIQYNLIKYIQNPTHELKLHLGCGSKHIDGFVNIDIRYLPSVDEIDNIKYLRKYKEDSVDLIYACHVLEHFGRHDFKHVLERWFSILKYGGKLRLAVPNFEMICKHYNETNDLQSLLGLLYGGQDYDENFHYMTFDFRFIESILLKIGFTEVKKYDVFDTEHSHIDDFSQSYIPHMDRNGKLMSLNVEAIK